MDSTSPPISLSGKAPPWSKIAVRTITPTYKYLDGGNTVDGGLRYVSAPLPRAHHSSSTTSTLSGEIFIFGGAVGLQLKNDTWAIGPAGDSENPAALEMVAKLMETTGETPGPRVGHRSVLAGRSLIVWGGITSVNGPDDASVYSLNIITHNWIKLDIQPAPSARALHAACMCGGKFVVFGGATRENQALDDLWSFDFSSSTPKWERIEVPSEGRSPHGRGGHVMVAYENKLYVFAGSNDTTLYNDTWCFDMVTQVWTELGFTDSIPPPRTYHAAVLVDDAMCVFGGCGQDWKELGDAWIFRIGEQKWCELPTGDIQLSRRSYHTAALIKDHVLVLGGEEEESSQTEGTAYVDILEKGLIDYTESGYMDRSSSPKQATQLRSSQKYPPLVHSEMVAPSQFTITGAMSSTKIFRNLILHGCRDASDLDLSHVSEYPVSSGGFGDVYCATLRNGDRVGLKCLRMMVGSTEEGKKFLKRAAHELYVWSKCKHPNVLELSGVMLFRDRIAMVSPWIENGHLRWFLSRDSEVDRCALCAQIANGIDYLHEQGIVHGDLKPENVLISRDHTPKLTDFGNAALAEYTLQFTNSSTTQSMSVRWTAPEILKQETKTTQAGDIFALGMIIFEVITGLLPYAGSSDPVVMFSIAEGKLPDRPEAHIPIGIEQADRLWSVVTSCWAYTPDERPKAGEVRSKLNGITPGGLLANPG